MHYLKQQLLGHHLPAVSIPVAPTYSLRTHHTSNNLQQLQQTLSNYQFTIGSLNPQPNSSTGNQNFAPRHQLPEGKFPSFESAPFFPQQTHTSVHIPSQLNNSNLLAPCSRLVEAIQNSLCSAPSSNSSTQSSKSNSRSQFVEGLVDIAESIINSIWPNHSYTSKNKLLPIQRFIEEILRRSRTSFSTLQLALLYLLRIKHELPAYRLRLAAEQSQSNVADCLDTELLRQIPSHGQFDDTSSTSSKSTCVVTNEHTPTLCGRRMFLAALVVAGKYLQDQTYSNRAWAKISGLTVSEINRNEMEFLKVIDYKLHVSNDTFLSWTQMLMSWTNVNMMKKDKTGSNGAKATNANVSNVGLSAEVPAMESAKGVKRMRASVDNASGLLSPNSLVSPPRSDLSFPTQVYQQNYLPSPLPDLQSPGSTQTLTDECSTVVLNNEKTSVSSVPTSEEKISKKRKRTEEEKISTEQIAALTNSHLLLQILKSKIYQQSSSDYLNKSNFSNVAPPGVTNFEIDAWISEVTRASQEEIIGM